jgi:hypothetical protein
MALNAKSLTAIKLIALSASLVYLAYEFTFHAHLVDLLGTNPSRQDIEYAEQVGRLLTGIALALLLVPLAINWFSRQWFAQSFVAVGVLAAVITILLSWGSIAFSRASIEAVVERLTESRTPEERRQAVLSLFIASHLHSRREGDVTLTLNGKDAPAYLKKTVPGRLVLAALPFLLSNVGDLEERTKQQMRAILADDLEKELGKPETLYNEVFVQGVRSLTRAFETYHEATQAYRSQMLSAEKDAYRDWEEYTDELRRNRISATSASRSPPIRRTIAETLRRRDPSLPPNWVPDSAEDFRVLRVERLQKAYEGALQKLGLSDRAQVPPPQTFESFIQHPYVRKQWCDGLPRLEAKLRERLCQFGPREGSSEALFPLFKMELLAPLVDEKLDELVARYDSPAAAYAKGGKFEKDGYNAAKTAIVIPVALVFSLLGGLAHVGKCMILGASFLSLWLIRLLAPGVLVIATFVAVVAQPAPMADDSFVAAMRQAIQVKYGHHAVVLADSSMKLERAVYPVGKALPMTLSPPP